MKIVVRCPVCASVGKDGCHLFFKCKQVWNLLNLERELAGISNAREAVEFIV
jgi:hypothetical protein